MKITKHIAFFYREDRLNYLNQMIQAANTYPFVTDIYIHSNILFDIDSLTKPTNGQVFLIGHDLSKKDPLHLPCYVRPLMKAQRAAYDIFIYVEDDILIPKEAIDYWLAYKDKCIRNNCNLGFLRMEKDKEGREYVSDLHNEHSVSQQLTKVGKLEDLVVAINDVNPYVAFWIYDQSEFKRFTESYAWDPATLVPAYDIRAAAAIGMHQIRLETKLYLATVLPLTEQLKPLPGCRVYHLPSNYAEMPYCFFATLYFDETVCYDEASFRHPNMVIQRKHERLASYQSKQQPPLT
jgi:hypothetical protein